MNRWLLIGLALAALVWGYLTLFVPSSPAPDVSRATETARVVRVIDGDTVVLDDARKVRYLGIDAPEISHTPPEPFGPEAFALNAELVENRQVKLEYDTERQDTHGRTLAFVYVKHGGRWICVNAELVRQGLARTLFVPPNERYKKYLRRLELRAFQARRGMWSLVTNNPPVLTAQQAEREFNKYRGHWVTVRLRIAGVYRSKYVLLLNAPGDYKTNFTAAIFIGDLDRFPELAADPNRLVGQTIEVTGLLKEYNGPEIIVSWPWQLRAVQTGKEAVRPEHNVYAMRLAENLCALGP